MRLLLERHPNLDFFVLDIADAVPKDDLASMEPSGLPWTKF